MRPLWSQGRGPSQRFWEGQGTLLKRPCSSPDLPKGQKEGPSTECRPLWRSQKGQRTFIKVLGSLLPFPDFPEGQGPSLLHSQNERLSAECRPVQRFWEGKETFLNILWRVENLYESPGKGRQLFWRSWEGPCPPTSFPEALIPLPSYTQKEGSSPECRPSWQFWKRQIPLLMSLGEQGLSQWWWKGFCPSPDLPKGLLSCLSYTPKEELSVECRPSLRSQEGQDFFAKDLVSPLVSLIPSWRADTSWLYNPKEGSSVEVRPLQRFWEERSPCEVPGKATALP